MSKHGMVIFGGRGGEKTGFLLPYPNKLILTFTTLEVSKVSGWLKAVAVSNMPSI